MVHPGRSIFGIFDILNNYGTSSKINISESPLNIPTPSPAADHPLGGHELFFRLLCLSAFARPIDMLRSHQKHPRTMRPSTTIQKPLPTILNPPYVMHYPSQVFKHTNSRFACIFPEHRTNSMPIVSAMWLSK